jgi:hypothetical protein
LKAVKGPCGADLETGRVLAVKASDRYIVALSQDNDPDPTTTGVSNLMMVKGADQLAHPAPAAHGFRVLAVFEIADTLLGHFILLKQNITGSPYPCHEAPHPVG